MRRVAQSRISPLQAGLIALVLILIATFLAFTKDIPFTKPFELKATFQNSPPIQKNQAVRIAGVDVGKVSKVEPVGGDSPAVVVTMKLENDALPLHEDATVKVRPRIFFEGNLFFDIHPGSPSSPELDTGDTIPASQTSAPVQLDQVLGTLQADTRRNLQKLLEGYGGALNNKPQPGEDDDQVADVKGKTAGQALNQTLDYSPEALRGAAVVNQSLLGSDLHDLSKLVGAQQKVFAALDTHEGSLKDLITNFNTTMAALAAEQDSLRETANPALDKLNAAFPPTRAWALEMVPGVRETPATITAAFPWITQTRALLRPAELQGLVDELQPAVSEFAQFTKGQFQLLPEIDLFNRCQLNVILPTGDARIDDGRAGGRVAELRRQRLVYPLHERRRRLPGADPGRPAAGVSAVRLGHVSAGWNPPGARRQAALQAERPVLQAEAAEPERRADRTRPMMRQIRKQLRVFVALVCLLVGALAVAGYLLSQERFYLPASVPLIGTNFYEVKAELPTAQAVVPGQGQSVNIAGVKVGEVGDVELENGRAVVTMKIQNKYKPIYKDASVLLRPKTGLKDMILALDPGTEKAGEVSEGGRVKVSDTLPDVNADEVLAQLDTDTRAYLEILLTAGGTAFDDKATGADARFEQTAEQDLREVLKRFEPTAKYGAQ